MKKLINLVFLCTITLILSSMHGTLYAMHNLSLSSSSKRLKDANGAPVQIVPSKAEYVAALDAALLQVDDAGATVLHVAASEGNLVMCRDLLARGASPLCQNNQGLSPLHCAVIGNNHEIVQQLLDGMPNAARRERIITVLCILRRYHVASDIRRKLLSYLPDLITAYPKLCKIIVPNYITFEQLCSAHSAPQIQLLELKDKEGRTAHSIAKNNRNSFMARMIYPKNRMQVCKDKLTQLLQNPRTVSKENNE